MTFAPVQENQWRRLQQSAGNIDVIKSKAERIITGLTNVFKPGEENGSPRIVFKVINEVRLLAEVETDLGSGRLRLDWRSDESALFGLLLFERLQLDQRDRPFWEPGLSVKVPADGAWEVGGEPTTISGSQNLREGDKLYVLGLSILYVIINGPVKV